MKDLNELVKGCLKGCMEDKEELISRVMPLIIRMSTASFIRMDMREDMIQEGCLAALEAVKIFDESRGVTFTAFLKKVLYFKLYRRAETRNLVYLDEENEEGNTLKDMIADDRLNPEESVILEEGYQNLRNALENLREDEANVLEQRFLNGKSLMEIAETANKKYPHIVFLQKQGLKKMKNFLNAI